MPCQPTPRITKMRTSITRRPLHSVLCAATLTLSLAATAESATTARVEIFANDLGMGLFQYNLTVFNTGMDDISIISISDAPMNESIIGSTLEGPAGFATSYDPIGIIDLVEDTSTFTPGSEVSGFTFQSSSPPETTFQDLSGLTSEGESVTVTATVVPEPTGALLASVGILAFITRRRR